MLRQTEICAVGDPKAIKWRRYPKYLTEVVKYTGL